MASAIVRSTLRSAVRGSPRVNPTSSRSFSSGASVEEEAREASKWEKITYVGIAACSILAFVNLSKGHPHFEEPAPYPYLHIRNKEFPWGKLSSLYFFLLVVFYEYYATSLLKNREPRSFNDKFMFEEYVGIVLV